MLTRQELKAYLCQYRESIIRGELKRADDIKLILEDSDAEQRHRIDVLERALELAIDDVFGAILASSNKRKSRLLYKTGRGRDCEGK